MLKIIPTQMHSLKKSEYQIMRLVGTQNWIRWSLRYRLFRLLKPTSYEFTVPFFGLMYTGNLNNFIDRAVYFYGAHEREVMVYMGSRIKSGAVVLDIGANVGHHSLFFSTKAKEVHAFEPNAKFRSQFEQLMHENNIKNVNFHEVGLGEETQEAHYYSPTGDNQGIGSFVSSHHVTNKDIGTLSIVKGDDMVDSLGLERIDFIKIDVEGYEESVLKGLQKAIQKFKPLLIMEYAEADFESRDSFLSLTKGYKAYALKVNAKQFFFFNNPTCKAVPFNFENPSAELLLEPIAA